jgi:type IV secretion system protein VirB3
MEEPEQTIMRTSLSRPQQLLGGDRELVILSGLGAALMAVSVMTFLSFLIAFLGFGVIVAVLARIGKADPMMRKECSERHGNSHKDLLTCSCGSAWLMTESYCNGMALCWLHGSTGDQTFSPRHMRRWRL